MANKIWIILSCLMLFYGATEISGIEIDPDGLIFLDIYQEMGMAVVLGLFYALAIRHRFWFTNEITKPVN